MYPIAPFRDFTTFTPAVPAFYENIYSAEEGIKKILFELERLAEYANAIAEEVNDKTDLERLDRRVAELEAEVEEIIAALDGLAAGGKYRNPLTGGYDYAYVVAKQLSSALRFECMTWSELRAAELTWADIAARGKSYNEVEMSSRVIFGDGVPSYRVDPRATIETDTPGFKLI